jgi:hypothetical protein
LRDQFLDLTAINLCETPSYPPPISALDGLHQMLCVLQLDSALAPSRKLPQMTDCLHCDINDLVDKQLAAKDADLVEVAAKVAESLADVVLLAQPEDQAKLLAEIVALLGSLYLEKSGAVEGGESSRRH